MNMCTIPFTTRRLSNAGFSLIEIVITIAVISALVAVVGLPLSRFRDSQALQNTTATVAAVLDDARTKTLAALNNTSYGVRLTSVDVTLFAGTTYTAGAAGNDVYVFETPVTASWSVAGAGNTILFDRLKGTTTSYGTITLRIPSGTTRTITISALGAVSRN